MCSLDMSKQFSRRAVSNRFLELTRDCRRQLIRVDGDRGVSA